MRRWAIWPHHRKNFKDRRKGSKAKDGDQVVFDFVGSVDGEEFEGGSAEDYPLVLGSNSFIPGFEDQLVGAKAGEELDVNVTFPGDYGAENLAGQRRIVQMRSEIGARAGCCGNKR